MIIVDTNIICYLYLDGEYTAASEKLLLYDPDWHAPFLWKSEMRNVLALYLRKKILQFSDILKIMETAELLMRGREHETATIDVMDFVQNSNCSAYDCEFVALAHHLRVSFITTDRKIIEQFPEIANTPQQFIP